MNPCGITKKQEEQHLLEEERLLAKTFDQRKKFSTIKPKDVGKICYTTDYGDWLSCRLHDMTAAKDRLRDALHQLDTMCREDARFMVSSDGRVHDLVERVLAEVTP